MRATRTDPTAFDEPLGTLGQLLAERGLHYELFAIGGGALQVLGLITRPTRDIDVVELVEDARLVPIASLPDPLGRALWSARIALGSRARVHAAAAPQLFRRWLEGFREQLRGALRDLGLTDGDI